MEYSCNDIIKLRSVMPFLPEEPKYINNTSNNEFCRIYTAPANTHLIITNISYSVEIIDGGSAWLQIKDSSNNVLFNLIKLNISITYNNNNIITLYFPFELLPTDYLFTYTSVGTILETSIVGVERILSI